MPPKRKRIDTTDDEENRTQAKKQKLISSKSKSNLNQTQIIPKNADNSDKAVELSWSIDAPPEILFRIFSDSKLKPQDLRLASQVCWSWNGCLKDEAFGWFPLATLPLYVIHEGKHSSV
ncbi:F-box protein [Brasilonema sp. CT11]|nr:F-box protein [Brasilonema sp. CT11]